MNNASSKQIMSIIENEIIEIMIIAIIKIIDIRKNNEYNRKKIMRIIVRSF